MNTAREIYVNREPKRLDFTPIRNTPEPEPFIFTAMEHMGRSFMPWAAITLVVLLVVNLNWWVIPAMIGAAGAGYGLGLWQGWW